MIDVVGMNQYLVHFWDNSPAFLCWAEDSAHAVGQAIDAYPDKTPYSAFLLKLDWHSKNSIDETEQDVRIRVFRYAGLEYPDIDVPFEQLSDDDKRHFADDWLGRQQG